MWTVHMHNAATTHPLVSSHCDNQTSQSAITRQPHISISDHMTITCFNPPSHDKSHTSTSHHMTHDIFQYVITWQSYTSTSHHMTNHMNLASSPKEDEASNGGVALTHEVAKDVGWVASLHLQSRHHEIATLEEINNLSSRIDHKGPAEMWKKHKGNAIQESMWKLCTSRVCTIQLLSPPPMLQWKVLPWRHKAY